MKRFVPFLLLAVTCSAGAVVIRDDVADSQYRVAASAFPALVDLPTEGHGVLIAPRWIVTAAHAVAWQPHLEVIVLNGAPRAVEKIVFHPGYKKLPQDLIDSAMKSGDASAVMAFLASSDDVALVKLASPVADVVAVKMYTGSALGKVVQIVGKGATGCGAMGHDPHGPNRTDLRHAFNTVSTSEGRWLSYVFDEPRTALPLEGIAGNGDSGGPLLVEVGDKWQVAGLTSFKRVDGNPMTARPGKYGQISYGVRLSHYVEWIEAVTGAVSTTEKQGWAPALGDRRTVTTAK